MPPKNKQITPIDRGFFREIANQVKLILRLMTDPRVHPLIKLLPIASLIYLVFPDFFPLNPIDDALVVGLGTYMFIELCPPEVVQEHKDALRRVVDGQWRDTEAGEEGSNPDNGQDPQVIEGEFREK
jgi:uncharacterized membrane protein YkvA (DUF1232 family)